MTLRFFLVVGILMPIFDASTSAAHQTPPCRSGECTGTRHHDAARPQRAYIKDTPHMSTRFSMVNARTRSRRNGDPSIGNYTVWADPEGPYWMPIEVADVLCGVGFGLDQPAKYNLGDPIPASHPYQCCNACAKQPKKCLSWVFNQEQHSCQLKYFYSPEENIIPCQECVMYQHDGNQYAHAEPSEEMGYFVGWRSGDARHWRQDSFGYGGGWRRATRLSAGDCSFVTGYDQPTEFNLGEPVETDAAFECCDLWCRSWVWKASTHLCTLKHRYDATKNTVPCDDCVSFSEAGKFILYSMARTLIFENKTYTFDLSDDKTWPRETKGIRMPKVIAAEKCRIVKGYDQPAEYNLGSPIPADYAYECCNACADHANECRSWVFDESKKSCQLKDDYVPEENIIPCMDCAMYHDSGSTYVYQAYAEEKFKAFQLLKVSSKFSAGMFGEGGSWTRASECPSDKCRINAGFNQPEEFNLGSPIDLNAAYLCCDICTAHPDCKSWVWNRQTKKCYLKNDYDVRMNSVPCDDCVAYDENGGVVVFAADRSKQKSAFDPMYDLSDWRTWPRPEGIWMIEEIAAQKCRVKTGLDLPSQYNLDAPFRVPFVFQCCNECAKRMPECKAWVFHQDTKMCQLKMAYVPEKLMACPSCWVYDATGETYVHQGCGS